MRGLQGKAYVVAGGGSGIGAATAKRLVEEGAKVVVGDLDANKARELSLRLMQEGGESIGVAFDILDPESIKNLMESAVLRFGRIDGIHINSGEINMLHQDATVEDVSLDVFDQTLAVNLRGHMLCTRYAIPILKRNGGGSLVYTSSAAAFMGEPLRVAYAISKNGLHALVRHVATRWGKERIRANAVAPGLVKVDSNREILTDSAVKEVLRNTRSWRIGKPEDIAASVAFLMSNDGEWINGQVISVDGGITMR